MIEIEDKLKEFYLFFQCKRLGEGKIFKKLTDLGFEEPNVTIGVLLDKGLNYGNSRFKLRKLKNEKYCVYLEDTRIKTERNRHFIARILD